MFGRKNVLLLGIVVFALAAGFVLAAPTSVAVTRNTTTATTGDNTLFNVTLTDNPSGNDVTSVFLNYTTFTSAAPVTISCGSGFKKSTTVPGVNIINCTSDCGCQHFARGCC